MASNLATSSSCEPSAGLISRCTRFFPTLPSGTSTNTIRTPSSPSRVTSQNGFPAISTRAAGHRVTPLQNRASAPASPQSNVTFKIALRIHPSPRTLARSVPEPLEPVHAVLRCYPVSLSTSGAVILQKSPQACAFLQYTKEVLKCLCWIWLT
jgi:hypothetical protein